jgi:hypothetical protein
MKETIEVAEQWTHAWLLVGCVTTLVAIHWMKAAVDADL